MLRHFMHRIFKRTMLKAKWIPHLIIITISVISTHSASGASEESICRPDFTLHNISTSEGEERFCANIFVDSMTWDHAKTICRITFSHMTHRIVFNSSLHTELTEKGINFMWLGIRRRADFFVTESTSELFKEKTSSPDNWGAHWAKDEHRQTDCVALDLLTGSLHTYDCNSYLPFVCGDRGAPRNKQEDSVCPENMVLSYSLSISGKKCASLNEAQPQKYAEEICEESDGRLATTSEYDILHSSGNFLPQTSEDTAYWANKENYGSCVFKFIPALNGKLADNRPENCSKPLPFVCVKDFETERVEVWISPEYVQSFPSTSTCTTNPDLLTCKVKVNGRQLSGREKQLLFQWYKDDIPIPFKDYVFRLSYFGGSLKRNYLFTNIAARQGSYHCEVRLLGRSKSSSSPKMDFYYSDTSTYVININGMSSIYPDYSHHDFTKFLGQFDRSTMSVLVTKMKSRYPRAEWDFLKTSLRDAAATMQILLYIHRGNVDLFDEEKSYQEIKNLFEDNLLLFNLQGNISLAVNSADICFSKDTRSSDTCEGIIRWPTSQQASNVITDPMCLDERMRLVQRKCKADVMRRAEWAPFNCTSCKMLQPRIHELNIQCPAGYTVSKTAGLCYKVYYEKKNWDQANKICAESSSYLLNEVHDDIDPMTNIWLSYKYLYGKIQQFSSTQKTNILNKLDTNTQSSELHCISAHVMDKNYVLKLENCSQELSFVCIQNPYEILSSVKFSNTWFKQAPQETCYYFSENDAYNWQEAEDECQQIFASASLLKGYQNLNDYQHLKLIIHQLFQETECHPISWWMNLEYVNGIFKTADLKFVDWNPYTNFGLKHASGVLSLLPSREIRWSLEETSSNFRYVCEIQNCDDIRPTHAYIENRSQKNSSLSTKSYMDHLRNFTLKCIPSGWFITKSMGWYKDGILLNSSSDHFSFSDISPTIAIEEALQYQSYYWCSVDQIKPIRRTFSSRILFKIPGVHTYVLSVESEAQNYLDSCFQYMTSELTTLEYQSIPVHKCFEDHLKKSLNAFHFLLKNITCNNTYASVQLHIHFKEEHGTEKEILKQIQSSDYSEFSKECNFDEESVTSRSTVACYGEKMALKNRNITWPTTLIGETAFPEELCLTDEGALLERKCLGDFNSGAFWSQVSVTECSDMKSDVTEKLHGILQSAPVPFTFPGDLVAFTSAPEELLAADVQMSTEILVSLANQPSFAPENLKPVVQTVNNLIDVPREVLNEAENSSSQIVDSLEHIAAVVDIEDESIQIAAENLAVSIHPLNSTSYNIPNCALLKEWSKNITTLFNVSGNDLKNNINDLQAGIVLPTTLVAEKLKSNADRVIFIIRQNFNYAKNMKVVGAVIQAAFTDRSVYDVHPPVEMIFKLNEDITNATLLKCVFWDQRLNDNLGGWSYKGCFLNKLHNGLITCSCNHLTSFTVILELNPTPVLFAHKTALTLITYIGCSLSCFGLGMIILTFIFFREWRKSTKNKALFNLSASLISFLIIFMAGIDKTSSRNWCLAIAVILHYLLLSSFAWMLVSAFMMYLSLVKVLATYIPRLIQKAMIFAWGLPAVIVITILGYKYQLYSQEKYCWLSQDIFYYAIASPILVMLIANFIIFGLILRANTCGKSKTYLRTNQDLKKLAIARTKALFCISVLLGLSWIFGFLAIGEAKVIFQYLFAITTTLQGFLVFIFFIVRQRSARELWRKYLFPSSTSEKSRISHITGSTIISNRIHYNRDTQYENLFRSVIFKANSAYSPYM